MAESHVISGLKAKQEEIKKRISKLKKEIKENQEDLAAVSKTLLIFGEKPRAGWNRFFRRGEVPKTVFGILRTASEALDIDQIATAVMEEHGFDSGDPELARTVRQRCMMAMYRYLVVSEQGRKLLTYS
jgi:hypothetical protein